MARKREVEIRITADNQASGKLDKVASSVSRLGSASQGAEGKVGSLGGIMVGALGGIAASVITGGIGMIANAVKGLASTALSAVSAAQALEMSIEGLLVEQIMYAEVATSKQVMTKATKREGEAYIKTALALQTHTAKMQEHSQKIIQDLIPAYGEEGLATKTAYSVLAEMEFKRQGMIKTLGKLSGSEGKLITVHDSSIKKVMELSEAQGIAKEKTKELMAGILKLAIVSPFQTSQVEQIAQVGLMSGMATDEIVGFTGAFLDYAAVHGVASSKLSYAASQFLEVARTGKITTMDLRQLRNLGLDITKVLGVDMGNSAAELTERFGDMGKEAKQIFSGMNIEEFNALMKKSPEAAQVFFAKFGDFVAEVSEGSAERMAKTFGGMMANVADIVELGSRELFRPIMEAVGPALAGVIDMVADVVTGGGLAEIGKQVGSVIEAFMGGKPTDFDWDAIFPPDLAKTAKSISEAFEQFGNMVAWVRDELLTAKPDFLALRDILGNFLPNDVINKFVKAIEILHKNWDILVGGFTALLISGVVPIIVSLLTTIGSIIATVVLPLVAFIAFWGLLWAAWRRDWGGIRTAITGAFNAVKDVILEVMDVLEPTIRVLGFFFRQIMRAFKGGGIKAAIEKFQELWPNIKKAVMEGLGNVDEIIGPILDGVTAQLNEWGTDAMNALDGAFDIDLFSVFSDIGEALGPLIEGVVEFGGAMLDAFKEGGVAGAIDEFKELWPGLSDTITTSLGGITEAIGPVLSNIAAVIYEKSAEIGYSILESLGGVLGVDLVTIFDDAITWISDTFTQLQDTLGPIWETISAVISSAVGVIWPAIQTFVAGVKSSFVQFGPMIESFKQLWTAIQPAVKVVLAVVGAAILLFVGIAVASFSGVANAIGPILNGVMMFITGLVSVITGVVNIITGVIEGVIGIITGNEEMIDEALEKIMLGVGQTIDGLKTALYGFFAGLLGGIVGYLSGFVDGVIGFFTTLYNKLVGESVIPEMIDEIIDYFKGMPGRISDAITAKMTAITAAGKSIVEGLKQGIKDAWDGFITWVKGQLGDLISAVTDIFKSDSPSQVFADIGSGLVEGMQKGWGKAWEGMPTTMNATLGVLPGQAQKMAQGSISAPAPSGGDTIIINVYDPASAGIVRSMIDDRRSSRLGLSMGAV